MAEAIGESGASGEPVLETLARVAARTGRALGAEARRPAIRARTERLRAPQRRGGIVLGNCPFHRLAERNTAIVCALNFELLCGVAEGAGDDATRDRGRPGCRRVLRARDPQASPPGASRPQCDRPRDTQLSFS